MNATQYITELQRHYAAGNATEHTHRPALKTLLESALPGVLVTNEPKHIECGAPDYVLSQGGIPLGYIEAKDLDKRLDDAAHKAQLKRYVESLDNFIFTNYLEFRLFRDGAQVSQVCIGDFSGNRIKIKRDNLEAFSDLLNTFAGYRGQTITTATDLAKRMALKARMMAAVITRALLSDQRAAQSAIGQMENALQSQLEAFRKHLIHDIASDSFADIYAQTVAYGMFAARLYDPTPATFSRQEAAELIPASNPFLRKFFQHIAGYDLDTRIHWIVDDLADLFRATDVGELMKGYGKATQQNDPFLHFYETFLGEYNPKLRKSRGVYYTPEPVVHFIVNAVDEILRTEFALTDGLADTGKTTIEVQTPLAGQAKTSTSKKEVHKVQILDPATGTGTFLAAVVRHIYQRYFPDKKGIWPEYVRADLIPRLNGFEVLMASYAMAHVKLEMVLRDSNCQLNNDRLRIFLTNSLEEHHPDTGTLFAQWLSAEANEANFIKRDTPVMVVLGNPPYSGISSNMGAWINGLIEEYKYVDGNHFGERKHWLHDDYVKFIRYGQHYIDRTGEGILAYINNHSFLDNPTFRGMRWSLLSSFDKIYILDLHGNSKKKETAPDGSVDKNVFDIQLGVSINIFIKTGKKKKNTLGRVFHYDLYGERQSKYEFLWNNDFASVDFKELKPITPYYFFVPKDWENKSEYEKGFSMHQLFPNNTTGIVTMGDSFIVANSRKEVADRVLDFLDQDYSENELKAKYFLGKNYGKWIISNKTKISFKDTDVVQITYRPFDSKWTIYSNQLIWRWRDKTMRHFLAGENVGLTLCRQFKGSENYYHAFVTDKIFESSLVSNKTSEIGYGFPLYLYPNTQQPRVSNKIERKPNLDDAILQSIANGLGLRFTPEKEDATDTFAPIDLLDYLYAVLHSPSYRERYKEFLKIDFPRVPYPTDKALFWKLANLGGELRAMHLLESAKLDTPTIGYPEAGDHIVSKPQYQITDTENRLGKVRINDKQYFENVPETAWNFHIGGYQPAQKWLKDRKTRPLNHNDITHYQKIIIALTETDRLMREIDELLW